MTEPKDLPPLTPRHTRFFEEYTKDCNATAAALRAGYSKRAASESGYRLLHRHDIAAHVAVWRAKMARDAELTAEKVVSELMKLAFANIQDLVDFEAGGAIDLSKIKREKAAAIAELIIEEKDGVKRTRLKMAEKRSALVDLGKHLGLFKDQLEHSGQVGHYAVSDKPMTDAEWEKEYTSHHDGPGKANGNGHHRA